MNLNPEQIFRRLMVEVKQVLPIHAQQNDVDLVSLLLVHVLLKHPNSKYSVSALMKQTVENIAKSRESVTNFCENALQLAKTNSAKLKALADNFANITTQTEQHKFFDAAVNMTSISTYRDIRSYTTPLSVIQISQLLFQHGISGVVQDLFARKGEWGNSVSIAAMMHDNPIATHNVCFDPYHYLIASLRADFLPDADYTVELQQYIKDPTSPRRTFDVVMANPPFGKLTHQGRKSKNTQEAIFLRLALDSIKQNGKIAFVVPESFLYQKGQGNLGNWELRKEVTEKSALKAVIRLPDATFAPYAKVKAAVLLIDFSAEHKHIQFIDITKNPLELTTDIIDKLHKILNEQEQVTLPAHYIHSKISTEQVKENDFNWQLQSYQTNQRRPPRPIDTIKKEIVGKQAQLQQLDQEIEHMLEKMRTEDERLD